MASGPYWSNRFGRRVWLTDHATSRAAERKLEVETVLEVIESGTIREQGAGRCWIWNAVPGRNDNLVCVAAILADAVIVKTVMHHFDPEGH